MNSGIPLALTFDTRRRGVLAFTCAVHLLALFLWTQERTQERGLLPAPPSRVVTILLQTDAGQTARRPSRTEPRPPVTPPQPEAAAPADAASIMRPQPVPLPEVPFDNPSAARVEATPAPDTTKAASDAIDPARPADILSDTRADTATPAAPASTQGGFAYGLAKRQAGRVDHELRKGKPGVPTEADTPWARFQRGLDSAHIDRSLALQSDTYTSPDGVVIYRFRQGNRVRCRRAGGAGMPLRGMPEGSSLSIPGSNAAGDSDCPKGVVWNRDD
jgi:hypothetical protein